MNELICTLIAIIVVAIIGVTAAAILRCGPEIRDYIKSFIKWNRNRRK